MRNRRGGRQLTLAKTGGWGGARRNAGRKPNGERAMVARRTRPRVTRHTPVHVTLRVERDVWNLRSKRSFGVLRKALSIGGNRLGLRLCDFSIQGNHLHLVVEADDNQALSRGMQGLSIRIAKALNRTMKRKGKVLSDRYHAHVLRTPREVKHALHYVRTNDDNHRFRRGEWIIGFADPYSSIHPDHDVLLAEDVSYLLHLAYRALGPPHRPHRRQ
jgi:putative transposase